MAYVHVESSLFLLKTCTRRIYINQLNIFKFKFHVQIQFNEASKPFKILHVCMQQYRNFPSGNEARSRLNLSCHIIYLDIRWKKLTI